MLFSIVNIYNKYMDGPNKPYNTEVQPTVYRDCIIMEVYY